jgi:mannose-6-phosphate isomerase-like protein (cupin superfamily)
VWHKHDDADEVFLVVEGSLEMHFRDGEEHLEAGELIVVPKGTEHMPVADEVAHVLLIEPTALLNTGDAPAGALTAEGVEKI